MAVKKKKNFLFNLNDNQKTLHKNLEFTATEQYKLLRANLSFTLPEDVKCPIIGVTSSMRGEGKSTTAINLSYVLAEAGKKVVLIDGDLRIPSVAKKMKISNNVGLTDCLKGVEALQVSSFKSDLFSNWYIIPSGALPPNPSELLGSRRMENVLKILSESFDYIIIDLPPVNIVSDALAISKYITGMIVVIREDYAEKRELENCVRLLKLSSVNVLGCVMNGSKSGMGYYSRRRYGRYGRYGKYSKYYKYAGYSSSSNSNSNPPATPNNTPPATPKQ